jgi:ABC-type arginine transport system ATPase subunit
MSKGYTGPTWDDLNVACDNDHLLVELKPTAGRKSIFLRVAELTGFQAEEHLTVTGKTVDRREVRLHGDWPADRDTPVRLSLET